MPRLNIIDLIVGKPLRTSEERAEQIGPVAGVSIFGLDGRSSVAYGPEAALSLLIPLRLLGVRYVLPVSVAIIALLAQGNRHIFTLSSPTYLSERV